jgi:hypothetical protein
MVAGVLEEGVAIMEKLEGGQCAALSG